MKIKGNEEGTSNDPIYCEEGKNSVRILIHFADSSLLYNNAHQFVRRLIMNDLMRYSESGEKYL